MEHQIPNDINAKIGGGREYRKTQLIECRAAEENDGQKKKCVRGYATTFNEQYPLFSFEEDGYRYQVFEQVDAHAFDDCDMTDVIMQYDHQGRVFARTRNNTLVLTPDEHGLAVDADLTGTTIGNQLYEEIQGGYTDRMSFGFRVSEDKKEVTRDDENKTITIVRTILKISKLYDVSAVSLPANDGTDISARGLCDGLIAEAKAERLAAEKELAEREALRTKIRILCEV